MTEPNKAVQHATDALQALERLNWTLRQHASQFDNEIQERTYSTLDTMRTLKASVEGSDKNFVSPHLNEDRLIELKQLTLMHIPSSVTMETRENFSTMVQDAFKGQFKSLLSITLLTCPWYQESQKERGEMAKHNILLIIFVSHDDQFFSPANPQVKKKASVIDFGWFCAIESFHFSQALGQGRTRYIEALYCREGAEIYSSADWKALKNNLDYNIATGTKGFQEACLGQAVGGISKKRKDGSLRLREGATIFEICESFRMLQHADNTLRLHGSHPDLKEHELSPTASTCLKTIRSFYDNGDPVQCKQELFQLIMAWAKELRARTSSVKAADTKRCQVESERLIGDWLLRSRLQGRELSMNGSLCDTHSDLLTIMQDLGGPVASLKPDQILMVAVAGSVMYSLNTSTSDVDYIIVYRTPTRTIMSTTKRLSECHESRGRDKEMEYGAYEARSFCEMLLKCSVVILELLFTDSHKYTSPLWQDLASHKKSFVTEKALHQYLGLVKNNFKFIEKGKLCDAPKRDRKLFYQIFHKLHCMEAMMKGEVPPVRVDGEMKEFIMNVRTLDQGEWSRENMLVEAKRRYEEFRERLGARTSRLRENPDYELCMNWLMSVRGLY